jgi:hypothetical protein
MIYIFLQSSVFNETAIMIKKTLNLKSSIITKITEDRPEDVYIMIGIHSYNGIMPTNYIVYQFEQLDSSVRNWFTEEYVDKLRKAQLVLDYSQYNCQKLKETYDINAIYCPLGSYTGQSFKKPCAATKFLHRVSFMGSENKRRTEYFKDLDLDIDKFSKIWGSERDKVVNRSLVSLNVHYYPEATLETTRIIYLISQGTLVVSEYSRDDVLDEEFKNMIIFADNPEEMREKCQYFCNHRDERNKFIRESQQYLKTRYKFRLDLDISQYEEKVSLYDKLPEPETLPYQLAKLEKSTDGSDNASLKLKRKPEFEDMPPVSILTLTKDRHELFEIVKRNWTNIHYPKDKLEWIIIDDGKNPVKVSKDKRIKHIHLDKEMSIANKRNLGVREASHDIIVHMDDDDYYYSSSVFARVKLLLSNEDSDVYCVGCSSYGIYHIIDNYSFRISTDHLAEASLAYWKWFHEEQPFEEDDNGEIVPFLRNRRKNAMDMPFEYNFIAITHNQNYTKNLREISVNNANSKNNDVFKSWDYDTQSFFIKVYKKII